MSDIGDVLSAASLFLTLLGLLYAAWYSEVKEASGLSPKLQLEDRPPQVRKVRAALLTRVVPLLVGSLLLVIALFGTAIAILSEGASLLAIALRTKLAISVEPLKLLMLSVGVFSIVLFVDQAHWLVLLIAKLKELRKPAPVSLSRGSG